jgi:hypothetical protein
MQQLQRHDEVNRRIQQQEEELKCEQSGSLITSSARFLVGVVEGLTMNGLDKKLIKKKRYLLYSVVIASDSLLVFLLMWLS